MQLCNAHELVAIYRAGDGDGDGNGNGDCRLTLEHCLASSLLLFCCSKEHITNITCHLMQIYPLPRETPKQHAITRGTENELFMIDICRVGPRTPFHLF